MNKIIFAVSCVLFLPSLVFAQGYDKLTRVTNADNLLTKFADLLNSAVWVLISLAVLFIVWNAVQFVRNAGGDARKKYQDAILWGIVGLFVILSIWGLVNILGNTFDVGNADNQGDATVNMDNLMLKRKPLEQRSSVQQGSSIQQGAVEEWDPSACDVVTLTYPDGTSCGGGD